METPDYYYNGDLENVITPVHADRLVKLLEETDYDPGEVSFLKEGFTNGFSIEYHSPTNRQSQSDNIPLSIGSHTELWNKLMKEVKQGRTAGPFDEIPFEHYIQSPIGLVPKSGSDGTRLIFYLSYDFKPENLNSVNHFTPKELCSVKYRDLDYAVSTYLDLINNWENEIEAEWDETEGVMWNCFPTRTMLQDKWRQKFDEHQEKDSKKTVFLRKK